MFGKFLGESHIKKNFRLLAASWSLVVVIATSIAIYQVYTHSIEHARIRAFGAFEKDILFRRWNAQYGGVYVPVTEYTQPNKYLNNKRRDVTTTDGEKLTLISPDHMTRQVYKLASEEGGLLGHITSLNPLRPENKPDLWESEALKAFEKGEQEVFSMESIHDKRYMRLMRPLYVERACLECHEKQGYREGEIRGGISVAVPMEKNQSHVTSQLFWLFGIFGSVWLFGMAVLKKVKAGLIFNDTLKDQAEQNLEEMNRHLEEMVEDRTAKLKRTQKELANEEKFSMLGKLAATIRHDLRNPLAVINNSSYYLRMKVGKSDENLTRHLNIIDEQIEYADHIIGDLLDFSKATPPDIQQVSIRCFIEEITSTYASDRWIKVLTDIQGDLPPVKFDKALMRRAIVNILTNAEQAISGEGEIYIRCWIEQERLNILINDNGAGIPDENLDKIFEPLFTTKQNGIGLGLMIVKEIVAKHGGSISVQSEEEKGSTFTMTLPVGC